MLHFRALAPRVLLTQMTGHMAAAHQVRWSSERITGKVDKWDDVKGYGFIRDSIGCSYFVHFKDLVSTEGGYRGLHIGQSVGFTTAAGGEGKLRAERVSLPDGSPLPSGKRSSKELVAGVQLDKAVDDLDEVPHEASQAPSRSPQRPTAQTTPAVQSTAATTAVTFKATAPNTASFQEMSENQRAYFQGFHDGVQAVTKSALTPPLAATSLPPLNLAANTTSPSYAYQQTSSNTGNNGSGNHSRDNNSRDGGYARGGNNFSRGDYGNSRGRGGNSYNRGGGYSRGGDSRGGGRGRGGGGYSRGGNSNGSGQNYQRSQQQYRGEERSYESPSSPPQSTSKAGWGSAW